MAMQAHEVGHNFGASHDGGKSTLYSACGPGGIMGGGRNNFSSCSLAAMQARLQAVLGSPAQLQRCFKSVTAGSGAEQDVPLEEVTWTGRPGDCPPAPPDPDECELDPPEPPEPPEEPECGDGTVQTSEQCDCGTTWQQCQVCTYVELPGTL